MSITRSFTALAATGILGAFGISNGFAAAPESRGFIGDSGNPTDWSTTSAVSISVSEQRTNGGSWAARGVFAINGSGVITSGADAGKHIGDMNNFTSGNPGGPEEDDDTHWMSVNGPNFGTNLHPAAAPGSKVTALFTLDQFYDLGEMHIYNSISDPIYTDTGIQNAEILLGATNSSNRADWTSVSWNASDGIITRHPNDGGGLSVSPGTVDEIISLDGINAKYVLLSGITNYGATWGMGLAEVRFFEVGGLLGDFNLDSIVDDIDIDMLVAHLIASGTDPLYDVNGDTFIDVNDLSYHVQTILGTNFGDTDLDGDVDLSDLSNLAANYGQSPRGWAQGNFDPDTDVDLNDLSTLATYYGLGEAQAFADFQAMNVPEPASLSLLGLGALALIRNRRV